MHFEVAVIAYINMEYSDETKEYHKASLQKKSKRKKRHYKDKQQKERFPDIGPEIMDYIHECSISQEGMLSGNERDLLQSILTSPIKTINRTVGQIIFEDSIDEDQKIALEKNGIHMDNEFALFINPGIVVKKLLKLTQWEHTSIGNVLMQVPGSFRDRERLDGQHLHLNILKESCQRALLCFIEPLFNSYLLSLGGKHHTQTSDA